MDKACIDSQFLKYFNTSEKFVPQMLNLDINELGLIFQKAVIQVKKLLQGFII